MGIGGAAAGQTGRRVAHALCWRSDIRLEDRGRCCWSESSTPYLPLEHRPITPQTRDIAVLAPPPRRLSPNWDRILTYMRRVDMPVSTAEIAKALELPRANLKNTLHRMAAAGVIERVTIG